MSPSHYYSFSDIAIPTYDSFETPLGDIEVDRGKIDTISKDCCCILDKAFELEHGLEVQLPFLKYLFPEIKIIPAIVSAAPSQVEQFINSVMDDDTVMIISADLSHFHEYSEAKKMDEITRQKIESCNYTDLTGEDTCGVMPIRGALLWAKNNDLKIKATFMSNSGDVEGICDKNRTVGYGAFSFYTKSSE